MHLRPVFALLEKDHVPSTEYNGLKGIPSYRTLSTRGRTLYNIFDTKIMF